MDDEPDEGRDESDGPLAPEAESSGDVDAAAAIVDAAGDQTLRELIAEARSKEAAAVVEHIGTEAALVAGVLETSLDRAISIDETRLDWANPLVPESPSLADALAIRFQQGETSWACLLPKWMLTEDRASLAADLPSRLIAALLPETVPAHQPRIAETAELIDADDWTGDSRPAALRIPCDGREDPIWLLIDVPAERIRIGRRRLQNVPVRIVVTLAEKRIEVGSLTAISPGTLITFSKPCEDLLDLYVNNQRFCRGEAVKIGEKFGLKITEMGGEQPRESPVLSPVA